MKNPIPISRDSFSGGTLLSDNWWAIVFQAIVFQLSLNFADILLQKNFQRNRGPVSFFSKHIRTFDIKKDKLICQISCFSKSKHSNTVGSGNILRFRPFLNEWDELIKIGFKKPGLITTPTFDRLSIQFCFKKKLNETETMHFRLLSHGGLYLFIVDKVSIIILDYSRPN